MLNVETTTQLFDIAAQLLRNKSKYLSIYSYNNTPDRKAIGVAAHTVDNKGIIKLSVSEVGGVAEASLDVTHNNDRYLVEVEPTTKERLARRLPIDVYAHTKLDPFLMRINAQKGENSLKTEPGDAKAIELVHSMIALGLMPQEDSLAKLRKMSKSEELISLGAEQLRNSTYTSAQIKETLNFLKIFQLTSVMLGSDLPR